MGRPIILPRIYNNSPFQSFKSFQSFQPLKLLEHLELLERLERILCFLFQSELRPATEDFL